MNKTIVYLVSLVLILSGASCSLKPTTVEPTQKLVFLTPWQTATSTPTATATLEFIPTATLAPTATSTPSEYVVKAKDTLIDIAYIKGITLAELKAANPKVNDYNLSIGTKLLIPAPKPANGTAMVPTATPLPITLHAPVCRTSNTGGLYCYVLVENDLGVNLENLSVEFRLTDPETGEVQTRTSLLPMEILPVDVSLPFVEYFSAPLVSGVEVTARLLTAIEAEAEKSNVFRLTVPEFESKLSADGKQAEVSGKVVSELSNPAAKQLRIAVVAYDAEGEVVGVRRYVEIAELKPGKEFEYRVLVYSTAGLIDHVEVFAEALK